MPRRTKKANHVGLFGGVRGAATPTTAPSSVKRFDPPSKAAGTAGRKRMPTGPNVAGSPTSGSIAEVEAPRATRASALPDADLPRAARSLTSLSLLRVGDRLDAALATVARPTRVWIRKPQKNEWVRTREDLVLEVTLLNVKSGGRDDGYRVLDGGIAESVPGTVPGFLAATINQEGVLGAWPLPWPSGDDGSPCAHYVTALRAAKLARDSWINIQHASLREGYRITPVSNAKVAAWGDLGLEGFERLVRTSDHYIESLDHPVLRLLRGEF